MNIHIYIHMYTHKYIDIHIYSYTYIYINTYIYKYKYIYPKLSQNILHGFFSTFGLRHQKRILLGVATCVASCGNLWLNSKIVKKHGFWWTFRMGSGVLRVGTMVITWIWIFEQIFLLIVWYK